MAAAYHGRIGLESPLHLLVVLVIALVVLGPKRLPEMSRSLGRGLREFKDSLSGAGDEEKGRAPLHSEADTSATGSDGSWGAAEVPTAPGLDHRDAPTAAPSEHTGAAGAPTAPRPDHGSAPTAPASEHTGAAEPPTAAAPKRP